MFCAESDDVEEEAAAADDDDDDDALDDSDSEVEGVYRVFIHQKAVI